MCVLTIVDLPNAPFQVCQYVLARFIIFCVFSGLSILYVACVPNPNGLVVGKLMTVALGLEVCGLLVAAFYVGCAFLYMLEVFCTALVFLCCCAVCPLVHRAERQNRFTLDSDNFLVATTLVAVACREVFVLCCAPKRRVAPAEVAVVVQPIDERPYDLKATVVQVIAVSRAGMNMV